MADEFTLTDEQRREATQEALGVKTMEDMVALTLDTMTVMVGKISTLQQEGRLDEALRWAEQFEKSVATLPRGLTDAIIAAAVVRLALVGPATLANSHETIQRAVKGARNLHDFGII